jgi:acyl-CoA reductase-like NAD-dependent aldehyde dehydrogenase
MSRITRLVLPSALALAVAALAIAQQPQQKQGQQQMQQQRRAFMEQMQERNRKLDDLVAKMNAAKGEKKVDAIAAVINEMMEQRKAMAHPMGGGPMGGPGGPMMPAPQGEAK